MINAAVDANSDGLRGDELVGIPAICPCPRCRKAAGRLARRVRSFSRMIWVSVTEVRSSPEAASTTEISRPVRIISSISSRVTYRLSCVS